MLVVAALACKKWAWVLIPTMFFFFFSSENFLTSTSLTSSKKKKNCPIARAIINRPVPSTTLVFLLLRDVNITLMRRARLLLWLRSWPSQGTSSTALTAEVWLQRWWISCPKLEVLLFTAVGQHSTATWSSITGSILTA